MPTPDDTFERLKRITWENMAAIVRKFHEENNGRHGTELTVILKANGWEPDFYQEEWQRRHGVNLRHNFGDDDGN